MFIEVNHVHEVRAVEVADGLREDVYGNQITSVQGGNTTTR